MTTTVQRKNDRVVLEGVEGFTPGEYASSVHGAQARILQAIGDPLSYEDLICYGGFAFRIGAHEQMCPSAGHPCCGYMCVDRSCAALPRRMQIFESFPWSEPRPDQEAFEAEACAAIKESIDRGVPVHYGSEEDGLMIGYTDEGRRWWCLHPYHQDAKTPFRHDEAEGFAGGKWPWGIVVWQGPKPASERTPEPELLTAALEQAVTMWNTEKVEAYFCGRAAYAHWIDWLKNVEAGTIDDPRAGMQGNGWCFDVLIHSRRIAARWLAAKADALKGHARQQLLLAANHYGSMAGSLAEGLDCPWDLALAPERADEWTHELRRDQIRRLEAALEEDRMAIAAIGEALGQT